MTVSISCVNISSSSTALHSTYLYQMKMSNNLLTLTAINKDLGEDFDNIIVKCRERRKVLLETNRDITVKVSNVLNVVCLLILFKFNGIYLNIHLDQI